MFRKLMDDLYEKEGGFVNHKADKGGATKYGITKRTLAEWRDNPVTEEDVLILTKTEAEAIYMAWYYKRPQIDKLPEVLQPFMFDACVNHGAKQAWKFMQLALNNLLPAYLEVDGIPGKKTFAAIEKIANGDDLIKELVRQREIFYAALVTAKPSQKVFLKGWMARAKSFLKNTITK